MNLKVPLELLMQMAPFSVVLSRTLEVLHFGVVLQRCIPGLVVGDCLSEVLDGCSPPVWHPVDWYLQPDVDVVTFQVKTTAVKLQGRFFRLPNSSDLIFQCAPVVFDLPDVYALERLLSGNTQWNPVSNFVDFLGRQNLALQGAHEMASKLRQQEVQLLKQNRLLAERNTLLVQAQAMIQKQEEEFQKFSLIAAQTNNSVLILNKSGAVDWVNKGFERMLGYAFEEVVGRSSSDLLFSGHTSLDVVQRVEQAWAQQIGFSEEFVCQTKHGDLLWVLMQCQPILDSNKELTGYLIIKSDVSEKHRNIQALRAERDKLSLILECLSDGVLTVNSSGFIDLFNQSAADLMGVAELQGRALAEVLKLRDATERYIAFDDLEQSCRGLAQERIGGAIYTLENPLGVQYTVQLFIQRLDVPRQREFLFVLHDVTYSVELDRIKRDFVSSVSHELNTPLTSLKGFISILRTRKELDEQTRDECLDVAAQQTDRLACLVKMILEFSKIEAQPLQKSQVNLARLVRSAELSVSGMPEAQNVRIESVVAAELENIELDGDKIESVLVNLLSNAIKYSPSGGTVSLEISSVDGQLIIRVSDQGSGISAADIDKIFDRFYRVASVSQLVPGTGLGLSIVKRIVDLHDGHISVKSTPGVGSEFTITLPIAG